MLYNTCDLFFFYRCGPEEKLPTLAPADGEGLSVRLMDPRLLGPDDLAFASTAQALAAYSRL